MYCKRRKSSDRFPDRKARNRLYACHCIAGNGPPHSRFRVPAPTCSRVRDGSTWPTLIVWRDGLVSPTLDALQILLPASRSFAVGSLTLACPRPWQPTTVRTSLLSASPISAETGRLIMSRLRPTTRSRMATQKRRWKPWKRLCWRRRTTATWTSIRSNAVSWNGTTRRLPVVPALPRCCSDGHLPRSCLPADLAFLQTGAKSSPPWTVDPSIPPAPITTIVRLILYRLSSPALTSICSTRQPNSGSSTVQLCRWDVTAITTFASRVAEFFDGIVAFYAREWCQLWSSLPTLHRLSSQQLQPSCLCNLAEALGPESVQTTWTFHQRLDNHTLDTCFCPLPRRSFSWSGGVMYSVTVP